jgi:hypothetical protein
MRLSPARMTMGVGGVPAIRWPAEALPTVMKKALASRLSRPVSEKASHERDKPPIQHIVFDIGKVLIHYDPNIPFSRLIPDEAERNAFFDTVCTHEWNLEQDRGRSWTEAEALLIARFPDKAELIRAFRTALARDGQPRL